MFFVLKDWIKDFKVDQIGHTQKGLYLHNTCLLSEHECLTKLVQKKVCVNQLELGDCDRKDCQFFHEMTSTEVFELHHVIRDVPQLPTWLLSSRALTKFERLYSLYEQHAGNILETDGPLMTILLLNCILTDLENFSLLSNEKLPSICKKLWADFEDLYPSATFSQVNF